MTRNTARTASLWTFTIWDWDLPGPQNWRLSLSTYKETAWIWSYKHAFAGPLGRDSYRGRTRHALLVRGSSTLPHGLYAGFTSLGSNMNTDMGGPSPHHHAHSLKEGFGRHSLQEKLQTQIASPHTFATHCSPLLFTLGLCTGLLCPR